MIGALDARSFENQIEQRLDVKLAHIIKGNCHGKRASFRILTSKFAESAIIDRPEAMPNAVRKHLVDRGSTHPFSCSRIRHSIGPSSNLVGKFRSFFLKWLGGSTSGAVIAVEAPITYGFVLIRRDRDQHQGNAARNGCQDTI